MKLEKEMIYDASPAEVFEMLATEDFRRRVCEQQQVLSHEVAITREGEGMDVAVDQIQRAQGLPSFATKIVGSEIAINQREHWTSPTDARLDVAIPGKPGSMKGTVTLRERDGGTVETVSVDIKVSIPLVGGKLEKLIGDLLGSALRAEHKVGQEWLSS